MKKHLLLFLTTVLLTSVGWAQAVYVNNFGSGAGDRKYSNLDNWKENVGGVDQAILYINFYL